MAENHIQPTPGPFEPPDHILAECRSLDPTVDLHYIGDGRWALGSVKENTVRSGIAGRIKRRMERGEQRASHGAYWLVQLHYRGFGVIGIYDWQELGLIPHDFARKDANYRQGRERAFREAEARSEGPIRDRTTDEMLEEMDARFMDERRRIFRNRTISTPA